VSSSDSLIAIGYEINS